MRPAFALCVGLSLLLSPVRGEDIPPDTVVTVKKAAAFIRVEGKGWKGTGSGFVVSASKDSALVATNYHVVAGPDADLRLPPAELARSFKQVSVAAVFEGGTKSEVSEKAQIIAADPDNDLAVLRVTGLKNPPTPIEYANASKPVETMTVYSFGYPFGQALALGKASPAITVGKASVSSLRLDDDGELALVQIDGALNPGNSGGPMVDAKGRLVGVAVSRVRDGQGIGFAVPAAELDKLMKGRVGGFHMTANKAADGKLAVKAEIGLLDPTAALKGATLHYVVVPPKGTKPKAGEPLDKHAGAKKVSLKVDGGIATGELTLPGASGDIVVQVVPDGVPGGASKIRSYSLTPPRGNDAVVLGGLGGGGGAGAGEVDPPGGWKEYTPANKLYRVWVPEKSRGQNEKSSTSGRPPALLTSNTLVVETTGGATYAVEQVLISPPRFNADRDELTKLLREVAVGDSPGVKTVREGDAKMGRFPGKEYVIERGASVTRARAFVIGSSLYLLRVAGPRDQVNGPDATTFLDSCRLQVPNRPNPGDGPGPQPNNPPAPAGGPPGGHAFIQGGRNNPEFKDAVPAGALLGGLEIGPGKIGDRATVKSLRAVFLTGEKESFGEWRGAAPADADKVRVVAKPGYAVGAVTVRTSLGIDGLSITFMKVTNGKLDPKDSYESDWIGSKAGFEPVKLGGHGELALGLIGKANENVANGLGLLYKEGQAPGEPVRPVPLPNPNANPGPPQPAAKAGDRGPRIHGSPFDPELRDATPPGGYLAGFEFGLGKRLNDDIVKAVRPVYRVGDKDVPGEQFGTDTTRVVKVVAKPGYAVGAITVRRALGVNGVVVTFMRVADGKLDPKDGYDGERAGCEKGAAVKIGGDGALVVGVLLKANAKDVTGLGLIYSDTNKPGLDAPWPPGTPTAIQGGGNDREFREPGPAGSLLVGLEVGLGRFVNNSVVKSVRPIFRAGDKDADGEWHGPTDKETVKEVVRVAAKPGYAVGAITLKTGLGIDGLSVTFMKVVDGKLDPKDSYESEWIGGMGGGGKQTIGDGATAIGLVGKTRSDTVSGLGLLLPPAKK